MTRHPAPSGCLLLAGALLLVAGITVLAHGPDQGAATPAASRDERPTTSTSAVPRTPTRTTPATPPSTTVTRAPASGPADAAQPLPSGLPLSGEGPAGDPVIQQVLDGSSPADLPAPTARRLVDLAARIWLAETTGAGRERWPTYFTDPTLRARYRDVRVQAAIARRSGPGERAMVRLVWAGTSASGETQDGRPATVLFEQREGVWVPVR
ncbi:hypothetical protein AB0A60_32815 [Streptomyces sp. NPDC046275]|uniref:hypothetical protein n=1 Tax=Streptomyces sp. NPDC046275 TaxID=3157201 RepID=UPI0033F28B71